MELRRDVQDAILRKVQQSGDRRQLELPDIRPFYKAMFVHSASAVRLKLLKEEFFNFGLHHWGKASVDERLIRSMKQGQRLYSKSAVASKHGISAPTMKRLIADGSLASKEHQGWNADAHCH